MYRHWHSNGRTQAAQDVGNNIRHLVRLRVFEQTLLMANWVHDRSQRTGNLKHLFGIFVVEKSKGFYWRSPPAIEIDTHVLRIHRRTTRWPNIVRQAAARTSPSTTIRFFPCYFVLSNTNSLGKSNGLGSLIYSPRLFFLISFCCSQCCPSPFHYMSDGRRASMWY